MSGWPFPSLGPGHTFRSRPVCGPYARETARMRTGLRPQSAARVVQVRRARYYLLPTFVSPAMPSRPSLYSGVPLPDATALLTLLYVPLPIRSKFSYLFFRSIYVPIPTSTK